MLESSRPIKLDLSDSKFRESRQELIGGNSNFNTPVNDGPTSNDFTILNNETPIKIKKNIIKPLFVKSDTIPEIKEDGNE